MSEQKHTVAFVGGAVAGSEAVRVLADQGVHCVVFEQNARPYGKIEDGLPRWHTKQRQNEYQKIDARLDRTEVTYLPRVSLGVDLSFRELVEDWGFSLVCLANGAWRDRPIPLEGIENYVGKGITLQNTFVYWFNHFIEAGYQGPEFDIVDGAAVVGGGLASIDVVKILQVELVRRALLEKGIEVEMHDLEKKGVAKVLAAHDQSMDKLGLQGCSLYYRRRPIDMPLASIESGAPEEMKQKRYKIRQRLLDNAQKKYLFKFHERCLPSGLIANNGQVEGIEFVRTEVIDGRPKPQAGTEFEMKSPLIISSIGSVPDRIDGLDMKGEYYDFADWDLGKLNGYDHVFGIGNVVTGQGNINVSRKHGEHVANWLLENVLAGQEKLSASQADSILERARVLAASKGYEGRYADWIRSVTPPEML